MGMLPEALGDLHDKYVRMLAMRLAHAESGGGEDAGRQARTQMLELSLRYPGALREIDDLELDEIRRRIDELRSALQGETHVEAWMEAMSRFHVLARGALFAKRWLRGRKHVDGRVQQAFEAAVASLDCPEEASLWSAHLACIASPPRGRVMDVVFARLAAALGITDAATRRLVFGLPRRERGALRSASASSGWGGGRSSG